MIRDTESGRFQKIAGPWKCVKCSLELETTPHQCPSCLKIRNKEYKAKNRDRLNEVKRERRLAAGKFCQWPPQCKDCGSDLVTKKAACVRCCEKRRLHKDSREAPRTPKVTRTPKAKRTPRSEAEKKKKRSEAKRRWYLKNLDHIKEYGKAYQQRLTPEKRALAVDRMTRWYQENKERYYATQNARRYRSQAAGGRYSDADITAIWDRQKHQCAVLGCTNKIASSGPNRYHVDHIKALVNGGSNTPDNLQILCRSHNCSKADADEFGWAQRHGMLFVK